jgi:histone deacetylase 1/2
VPSSTSLASHRHGLLGAKVSSDRWHQRLGHPSKSIIESVLRTNKIACAPSSDLSICDACQRAKVHQLPYDCSTHVTTSPLELVHSDVWGPAITSSGGFKYYVSFLDDFSHFTWIYFLKHKSDVEQAFYSFKSMSSVSLIPKFSLCNPIGEGSIIAYTNILVMKASFIVFPVHILPNKMASPSANTVILSK